MPLSPYIRRIRQQIGHDLLLLPAVAAVIHDAHGRLLLQQTATGWSLPAGHIEPGESPQQALDREVREETGMAVQSAEVVGVLGGRDFRHRYGNGDRVEFTVVVFRCTVTPVPDAVLDSETLSLAWFARTDMPPLDMPYPATVLFQT